MGALQELWWVSLVIGGPALIAVYLERRANKRKYEAEWAKWEKFNKALTKNDDKTFKTVEEYRRESD